MVRNSKNIHSVDVFTYTDFRLFIKDRYRFCKLQDRRLTYEKLGKSVGFASPGFFTQILQGKSKLPMAMVKPLCAALKMNKKETSYFQILVTYGQAESHELKHRLFKKLINKNTAIARKVPPKYFVLFDKWYYTVIRDMLYYYRFDGDFRALGRQLQPAITESEVREAVELLEKLHLVKKNRDGTIVRSDDDHLSTGFHIESVAVNNFLLEMMKLAQKSIETSTPKTRSLSTLTVSLSENGYYRLEKELHEFRRRLMAIAKNDRNEDRLYQINLQMFPLTKIAAIQAGKSMSELPRTTVPGHADSGKEKGKHYE